MEPDNIKPLDSVHPPGRLQDRIDRSSSHKFRPYQTTLSGPVAPTLDRSAEVVRSGCDYPCTPGTSEKRTLLSTIPHKETEREVQNDLQPERAKQVRPIQKIQDGDRLFCFSANPSSGVHVYNRPEGRLLPRPNIPQLAEVSQVRSPVTRRRGSSLSIQSPSLRDIFCTENLFKDYGRGGSISEKRRNIHHSVPGRPSGSKCLKSGADSSQGYHHEDSSAARLDHQYRKIQPRTKHERGIPGSSNRLHTTDVFSPSSKERKFNSPAKRVQEKEELLHKRSNEDPWAHDCMHPVRAMEPKSYKDTTELGAVLLGQRSLSPKSKGGDSPLSLTVHRLVDRSSKPGKRSTLASLASDNYTDGRKSVRLGSDCRRSSCPRPVAGFSENPFLESSGVKSCSGNPEVQHTNAERKACQNFFGQRHYGSLPTSPRGNQKSESPGTFKQNLHLGRRQPSIPLLHPPQGGRKSGSRLPQSEEDRSKRVVSSRRGLPSHNKEVGTSVSRPVCLQQEREAPAFLFPGTYSSLQPKRRVQPVLGGAVTVCLSSDTSYVPGHTKDQGRPGGGYTHSALVAKKELVSLAKKDGNGGSIPVTTPSRPPVPGSSPSSQSAGSPARCMDPERKILTAQGLSDKVISTMKASRKVVTHRIYSRIWKKFVSFCGSVPPNQLSPNISQILDFLQAGFDKGLKTSTLKVQVSALSAFFDTSLAEHKWIQRTLRTVRSQHGILWT
ncbi:uncharacterized protein [Engystomops pustulosus]|uniref:uncharacterized protein n=1 Tax=Engystomops pustulosus TaxID=76066 RepID=UPI003AFB4788